MLTRNMVLPRVLLAISLLGVLILGFGAQATTVDLINNVSGSIGAGYFTREFETPTGTGLIDPFVQVGGANQDVIEAYNTTVDGTLDRGGSDNFNRELLLTDVGTALIGSTLYRGFLLDANQTGSNPKYTLDEVQIFLSDNPNQEVTTFNAGLIGLTNLDASPADLVYQMDLGSDSTVLFDYSLFSGGSGKGGDLALFVPDSLFTGGGPYVYLYSRFGGDLVDGVQYPNNDGFEEWTSLPGSPIVPEPASIVLLGLGLGGILFRKTRKAV